MAFKRSLWKSGLTYEQTCEMCKTKIRYQDDRLDFRPWYADGFIYCPTCKKPLRHRETYAITQPEKQNEVDLTRTVDSAVPAATTENPTAPAAAPVKSAAPDSLPAFCTKCGHKFLETDRFCPQCGNRRG